MPQSVLYEDIGKIYTVATAATMCRLLHLTVAESYTTSLHISSQSYSSWIP